VAVNTLVWRGCRERWSRSGRMWQEELRGNVVDVARGPRDDMVDEAELDSRGPASGRATEQASSTKGSGSSNLQSALHYTTIHLASPETFVWIQSNTFRCSETSTAELHPYGHTMPSASRGSNVPRPHMNCNHQRGIKGLHTIRYCLQCSTTPRRTSPPYRLNRTQ
jgi:hypothetical protein